jgi:hypothetical protein
MVQWNQLTPVISRGSREEGEGDTGDAVTTADMHIVTTVLSTLRARFGAAAATAKAEWAARGARANGWVYDMMCESVRLRGSRLRRLVVGLVRVMVAKETDMLVVEGESRPGGNSCAGILAERAQSSRPCFVTWVD